MNQELKRLIQSKSKQAHWKLWGPYLTERQWGTIREDYSNNSEPWQYFSYKDAISRTYRWGEDGIAGISDNHQRLCFSVAFWNQKDPFLKERLFGLTGPQGNHGEDVKEYYYYLDNTPTHSYMKMLYKYPIVEFPYHKLEYENSRRSHDEPEYELIDTGIFDNNSYFDITIEYAKKTDRDIYIKISVVNRSEQNACINVLPMTWFRNIWSWDSCARKPKLYIMNHFKGDSDTQIVQIDSFDQMWLYCESCPEVLFTENNTNHNKLHGGKNETQHIKDGINDYIVNCNKKSVNPDKAGTKLAANYYFELAPSEEKIVRLRLSNVKTSPGKAFCDYEDLFQKRKKEADEFYNSLFDSSNNEKKRILRQAYAGLLWTKQFYHIDMEKWISGDPKQPPPNRAHIRNHEWKHLYNDDILSMPDKWEFPWFAAWDLAFHMIPFAEIDPCFAKRQLDLITREWYMHPNGQMPAYEWKFSDVNPPVHAWATMNVYQIDNEFSGKKDVAFLERVFQKLLLNFTWWVNRKDNNGNNIFQGGFLGLDNIGVFDRSAKLPGGGYLEQSDGTSWMGMYCLNMLEIALELAKNNPVYEDIACKFFEHFLYIADAMCHIGKHDMTLWDDEDGFYYDLMHTPCGESHRLKVRSMVGLVPLFAVAVLDPEIFSKFEVFNKRFKWFVKNRPSLTSSLSLINDSEKDELKLFAIVSPEKLKRILKIMLDEGEFFSDWGIRSLSKYHEQRPYEFIADNNTYSVGYEPAESKSGMFGGNSNWRGPVWFPVNYLIIQSLKTYHKFLGKSFKVECPTGSGVYMNLEQVADEISSRLQKIFMPDSQNHRPCFRNYEKMSKDRFFKDLVLFNEYFDGDTGAGLGASHQTGWTALIATLIRQMNKKAFKGNKK